MPVRFLRRVCRVAVTLCVLPALVLSPLPALAILIHDHHGHDTHSHALNVHELDEVQRNMEHRHEEHEHDGSAVDLANGEGSSLVILLNLSEALARGRAPSSGNATVAGNPSSPAANMVSIVTQQSDRSTIARPWSIAPPVRARGLLEDILLTRRALLL